MQARQGDHDQYYQGSSGHDKAQADEERERKYQQYMRAKQAQAA